MPWSPNYSPNQSSRSKAVQDIAVTFSYQKDAASQVVETTRRWIERAVIGLNLCPFAKTPHVKQRIRYVVSGASDADRLLDDLEYELTYLHLADPAVTETTLLIHPLAMNRFLDFHFFLNEAEAMLAQLDLREHLQIAPFHPGFEFGDARENAVENYSNRAPYPTLHLLRESSVARAVSSITDASVIYQNNIQTLRQLGHAGCERLWSEIMSGSTSQQGATVARESSQKPPT
jgi:uncharacterized protein